MASHTAMSLPPASTWDLARLRLPKLVEGEVDSQRLLQSMSDTAVLLWPGGRLRVPQATVAEPAVASLKLAQRRGQLLQGLESAQHKLAAEQRGMSMADRRQGVARGERVSRLLLLANDGAERFYRQVERLLHDHGPRLLVIKLEVDSGKLGHGLLGEDRMPRLLLLHHKQAVAAVLLDLFAGRIAD